MARTTADGGSGGNLGVLALPGIRKAAGKAAGKSLMAQRAKSAPKPKSTAMSRAAQAAIAKRKR